MLKSFEDLDFEEQHLGGEPKRKLPTDFSVTRAMLWENMRQLHPRNAVRQVVLECFGST